MEIDITFGNSSRLCIDKNDRYGTFLNLSHVGLTGTEPAFPALLDYIKTAPIELLDLSYNKLRVDAMDSVFKAVNMNKTLKVFRFQCQSRYVIGLGQLHPPYGEWMRAIIHFVKNNTTLAELTCDGVHVENEKITEDDLLVTGRLILALRGSPSLVKFSNIGDLCVQPSHMEDLAILVRSNSVLKEIRLGNLKTIEPSGNFLYYDLITAIERNNSLQLFDIYQFKQAQNRTNEFLNATVPFLKRNCAKAGERYICPWE